MRANRPSDYERKEELMNKTMETNQMYMYPRPFANAYDILSERQIRQMIAEGKVPGIRTEKGFKINVSLFLEQLEEMSRQAVTSEGL